MLNQVTSNIDFYNVYDQNNTDVDAATTSCCYAMFVRVGVAVARTRKIPNGILIEKLH